MGARRPVFEGCVLTPREEEILILIAKGMMAKQISAELGISERTVESHMAEIRYQLRAKTVAHAVAIGIGVGIIRPESMSVEPLEAAGKMAEM